MELRSLESANSMAGGCGPHIGPGALFALLLPVAFLMAPISFMQTTAEFFS
jgi:hypothetical protein